MRSLPLPTALVLVVAALGCNSGDTQDQDPECGPKTQCPQGYVCSAEQRCVLASSLVDARGAADGPATPDAATRDAATSDAPGPVDAATADASPSVSDAAQGPPDASRPDANRPDSPPGVVETALDSTPDEWTSERTSRFTFSSPTAGASFECALDGRTFATCSSPVTYPDLTEGEHDFAVRATHGGVTDATPETFSWLIDTTGPTVTLTGPAQGSTSGRSVSFGFTAEAGATFRCALDAPDLVPCAGGTKGFTMLAGGAHVFRVRAADGIGNDGPLVERSFVVDATPPVVTIMPLPSDRSGRDGTISYTADETAAFACKLDLAAAFSPCPASGFDFQDLDAGAHTLQVSATDAFDNLSEVESYTWTILPIVNVTVWNGLVPAAGVKVYAKGPSADGLPIEATTDVDGRAEIAVPAGGSVTTLVGTGAGAIGYTALGVQPFDEVTLGRRPFASGTSFGIARSLPAPPAGATCNHHVFGDQRTGCVSAGSPNTFFVGPIALDSTGKVSMLVTPSAGPGMPNDALAFGWVQDITVVPGGTVAVNVGSWQSPVDRTLRLLNVPGEGALVVSGVGKNGLFYEEFSAEVHVAGAHAVLDVPLKVPPAGVGEGVAHAVTSSRRSILSDAAIIDGADFLPPSTGVSVTRDPTGTKFTVGYSGPADVDGMVTVLSWQALPQPNSPIATWYIAHPPGPFTAPVITGLNPAAPTGTVTVSQLAIEVSSWDARRFRRDYPVISNWRRLFEINFSVGPEPYLGPGVVGRVTHTVATVTTQ